MPEALIKRIHDAVKNGELVEPITAEDVERWMAEHKVVKEDGKPYSKGYVPTLLSCSLIKPKKTKNRNSKWLRRRFNEGKDVHEYWFAD